MRYHSVFLASLLALGLGVPNAANAQCVGFTDTPDDVFCPAVEWLKNRSITTGCTGTEFCPSSPVSRLAMAQFMNRLGKAITPVVLHKQGYQNNVTVSSGTDPGTLACETVDYLVEGYPRTARFLGFYYGVPMSSAAWLHAYWKYSTDAGVTWTNVGTWGVDTYYTRDWAGYGQVAGTGLMAPPMALDVGTTYRFGLFLSGIGAAYTYNPIMCQIEVTILGANPATSPRDP
jgi:hypothetical protein